MQTLSSSPIKEEKYSRKSCLKLELSEENAENSSNNSIFVMATWFSTHFSLSITDGLNSWICIASEEDVRERASQWDQSASEYVEFAEKYLGFQQFGSVYRFSDAGNGYRRLSFTFEKEGVKLEWRWRCKPSPDSKKTTAAVLDFLMESNINLSVEVVKKDEAFEKLKAEAEKCLALSEKLSIEKEEFESEVYAKFVNVLNAKKGKLRELRDRLSKEKVAGKQLQEEDVSSENTVSYHTGSDKMEDSEDDL
ncbi:hypothetical protein RND81_14G131800 [Saponaria officinalis]|uniref:DNA repair protein XRCC4 n=1 Tax=Saponaria officinalis TaxID=3572 RepID=A0AAW1GS20_SAPOF